MTPKLTYVTLDPKVWYRGQYGAALLKFINGRRQQCCVGVVCTKLGVPDEAIVGKAFPGEVDAKLPALVKKLDLGSGHDDHEVYVINDDLDDALTDAVRVSALNAELKKHSIPLRFRLKRLARKSNT